MKYLSDYMQERQTALIERLGVFFAYNDKQFNEKKIDGVEYVTMGIGQICPKDNVEEYISEMNKLIEEAIKQDLSENGRKGIIHRELGNHEFCITYDVTDTVNALEDYGITEKEVRDETKPYLKEYYKWQEEQEKGA